ncbi:MAG: class I SAM-dependent methyltransferase [Alphaproteobacteria bacterium]
MGRRSSPDWREDAALSLLADHVSELAECQTLVALDRRERLRAVLPDASFWHRHARAEIDASAWPEPGLWPRIILRLPKAKAEQDMLIGCLASRLKVDGSLLIAAANDEGAKSLPKRMKPLWAEVDTVALGKRCRVLRLSGPAQTEFDANDWQITHQILGRDWASWPGLFAAGRIDAGTALLIDHLPDQLVENARVLDFACGTGILAAHLAHRHPTITPVCLDNDMLALTATRLNLPQAVTKAADHANPAKLGKFELILSNPPFHTGKGEDHAMLADLVQAIPHMLSPRGEARLVVQSKLRLDKLSPKAVELATAPGFTVWQIKG